MKSLITRLVFFLSLACVPHASAQQVTGRFYPEKEQYLVGEPIIVVFEIANDSAKAVQIGEGSCDWANSGQFKVDHASAKKREVELYGCGPKGYAGSCLGSSREIPSGTKYLKRVLLDGPFRLDLPGSYHISAKREQRIGSKDIHEMSVDLNIDSEFDVTLRTPRPRELEAAYKPLFDDLRSRDWMVRSLAATAIAQNPPSFAESAILGLGSDSFTLTASIDGLRRLATPATRAKLIEMSSIQSPEYVRQPAIEALGKIGNAEDCQAMLNIASENQNFTQAEAYIAAGRICKEEAIPSLSGINLTGSSQLLQGVAGGFGNTSSRNALLPVINLLQNQDQTVRRAAADALATLTHLKSKDGVDDEESAKQSYSEWLTWWSANGKTTRIYSSDQCTAPQPFP